MDERINRSASEPFSISQSRFSRMRLLTSPTVWYRAAMLVAVAFFVHSLLSAGPVWDETEEFLKLRAQLSFAGDILSGATGGTFHSLPGDSAYYGAGTVFLPYVLSYLIDNVWLKEAVHTYEHSYSVLLHILTFLYAIAAAAYTRRLVSLVTGDRDAGFLAGDRPTEKGMLASRVYGENTLVLTEAVWLGYLDGLAPEELCGLVVMLAAEDRARDRGPRAPRRARRGEDDLYLEVSFDVQDQPTVRCGGVRTLVNPFRLTRQRV